MKNFIGQTVEQVRCDAPEYSKFVGRRSKVVEAFEDEKGQTHVKTEDGVWCPLRLVAIV